MLQSNKVFETSQLHFTMAYTSNNITTSTTDFTDDTYFVSFNLPLKGGQTIKMFSKDFLKEKQAFSFAKVLRSRRKYRPSVKVHLMDAEENLYTYNPNKDMYYEDDTVFDNASRPMSSASITPETSDVAETETLPFEGMFVESYGKGYLLIPSEDHPDVGTKYYHEGWWMPKNNAWFFRSKYFDELLSKGAVERIVVNSESESENEQQESDFSGMLLEAYGKGYLLTPPEDHQDVGTKYYNGGWWKPSLDGWFFKKEYYTTLVENGASIIDEDEEETYYDISLKGMTYAPYGKGFLLTPQNTSPLAGTKEFLGGWWMPKHNAWFFKAQFENDLISHGAVQQTTSTRRSNRISSSR